MKHIKTFESFTNESTNLNIPYEEWEITTNKVENGWLAFANYKGKYYKGISQVKPGKDNSEDEITDIEVITKKEYETSI